MAQYQIKTPMTLFGDPQQPLHAVTKRYVDAKVAVVDGARFQTGVLSLDKLPALSGDVTSSAGSNIVNLVDSGVVAGIKFRVDVDAKGRIVGGDTTHGSQGQQISWNWVINKPTTLSGYGITDVISTAGGTSTTAIASGVEPTASLHAVRRSDVDTRMAEVTLTALTTGDMVRSVLSATPAGMLRANGGVVSKSAYAALYAVIGDTFSSGDGGFGFMGQPWRQQYAFNTEQSTDITGWTTGTSLPAAVALSQAIVTKNRVYLLGGVVNGSYSNAVYTAPILSDGTLGTWTTGTSLPTTVAFSQTIVTKNRVYLVGGVVNGSYSNAVYTAPILSDGTLGTWTTGTSLPTTVAFSQTIVTKNRVYLLGGIVNGSYSSTVYTAPILPDGTLGTWTTGTPLPAAVQQSQAIVTKDRVYLLGGVGSSTVYTAPILPDGTLGTWTTGTSLPATVYDSQVIVTKNRVYLLGGDSSSTVYTAPILSDGTLGPWTTGTSLPGTAYYSQAIVTKNRVYLLGGIVNTNYSSTVYTAPFSGGTNDYLTLIADSTIDASTQFKLPDYSNQESDGLYYYIKY